MYVPELAGTSYVALKKLFLVQYIRKHQGERRNPPNFFCDEVKEKVSPGVDWLRFSATC